MFNTNLVLPLLALGLYSHHHSINLANNTSLLIIVLALALQQREISKIETELAGDGNCTSVYRRTTNTTCNNHNGQTMYSSSNFPYTQTCPCNVNWQNGNCGNCGCGGNCPNFGFTTFN